MTIAPALSCRERPGRSGFEFGPLAISVVSAIGVSFVVLLTLMCGTHTWNFDPSGHPIVNDFVSFWAAGELAIGGHAAAAYDPNLRHAAEIAVVGHAFPDVRGWWYPPLFLFVVSALAFLPYATAFNVMNNVTLVLHAATTAATARRRAAFFLATAAPWSMFGMIHGQNQFLTAALVGGVLLNLEARPVLAGLLLGLLSYKPQLGILFPVALAFGGYWRAFGWAVVSTVILTVLSGAVFGFDTFAPFVKGLFVIGNESMSTVPGYLPNLQSLYGVLRCLGVASHFAWLSQGVLSILCVIAVAALWHGKVSFNLKAAGLTTAIPLFMPYFEAYDLALLSVSLSFLYRSRTFTAAEWIATAIAALSFATFFWETTHPATLIACGAVGAVICSRMLLLERSHTANEISQSSQPTRIAGFSSDRAAC